MSFRLLNGSDLDSIEFKMLLSQSLYQPSLDKQADFFYRLKPDSQIWGYFKGTLCGVFIVEPLAQGYEIKSIVSKNKHKGVGRSMIFEWLKLYPKQIIRAQTDADSVGFYHALGFRIHSLGQIHPGVERFDCIYDETDWAAFSWATAFEMVSSAGVPSWVAGGWALDLYLGKETRPHADTDLLMLSRDRHRLFDIFKGWEIYQTSPQGLRLWDGGLAPNFWLRKSRSSPWCLEVLLMRSEGDEWVYKRDPKIRGPIEQLGLKTAEGVSYLRPEIQLLYKMGSSKVRPKDHSDFSRVWPELSKEAQRWLKGSLNLGP